MEKLISPTDLTLTLELINNALAVVSFNRIDSVRVDNHDATIGVVRGVYFPPYKDTPEHKLNRREVVMAIKGGVCDLEWDIAEIRDWWSDDETLPEF
tara:strand:+ start:114 stop:404 length:291 start_codon:yes stop_codon:yes gene_type:complete